MLTARFLYGKFDQLLNLIEPNFLLSEGDFEETKKMKIWLKVTAWFDRTDYVLCEKIIQTSLEEIAETNSYPSGYAEIEIDKDEMLEHKDELLNKSPRIIRK